jgi:hypothetical protein
MPVTEEEKRDQAFKRYEETKERLKKDLGTYYGAEPTNYDTLDDDIEADAITDRIEQKLGDVAIPKASSGDNDFAIYNRALAACLSNLKDVEYQGRLKKTMFDIPRDIDEEMKEIAKALRYHEHELHLYSIDSNRLSAMHKRSLRAIVNEEVKRLYGRDLPTEPKIEEKVPAPELGKAIVPARTYLIRSEKGLAYAGLVDYKIELPSKAPMCELLPKNWTGGISGF